MHFLNIISLYS